MFHLLMGLLILALVITLLLRLVVNPLSSPAAIGLTAEGSLQPCKRPSNCVSSQAPADSEGHIAAFEVGAEGPEALEKVLSALPRAGAHRIVQRDDHYVHTVFTTPLMGYRDDLELLVDTNQPGQVQVRSASRIGRKDFGKNRQRVELIRQGLSQP